MVVEALEHAAGLDRQHEAGVGAEVQMLDRARNAVGTAAETGAIDLGGFAGRRVLVDHREPAGDRAAMGFRIEAQLLA